MKLLDRLLELLYPPRCIFCRRFLEKGGPHGGPDVCPACRRVLPWTSMCGRQKRRGISVCVSPLYYEGPVKDCVHRYKFYGAAAYTAPCAALMEECVRASIAGAFDAVSWVPLSRRRLRSRGYDQALLLAFQRQHQMLLLHLRIIPLAGQRLCALQRFNALLR